MGSFFRWAAKRVSPSWSGETTTKPSEARRSMTAWADQRVHV